MTRPRGNATSKAHRESRRATVVEVLKENPAIVQADLAEVTGVSLSTVKRDLAELRERFSHITDERYEEFKRAQLAVFELIERNLIEGEISPEVSREWRGIRGQISELLGLNAPKRAVVGHVSAPSDPVFLKFKEAVWNLTDEQIHEVLTFAKNLPRLDTSRMSQEEFIRAYHPQLTTGENDNAGSELPRRDE
jgi:Winged helix-turn-helix DNA-binding